jgi:glucokinase
VSEQAAGRYVIGGDLGGTRFRVVLADEAGRFVARGNCLTEAYRGRDAVIERLKATIREVLVAAPRPPEAIALSAPGPLDPWKGIIHQAPNLPGWDNIPVKDIFEQEFGIPFLLGHDANVAALAEFRYGAGRGTQDMIYITVSTGIGGGIIHQGRMLLGHGGGAGEVGHMTLEIDGPLCGCGNRGCLEALASGPAIRRQAADRVRAGEASSISARAGGDLDKVSTEIVVEAARDGDALAIDVMRRAGLALGTGLANLMHIIDPEIIVLGGGVTHAGELLFAPMREAIECHAMPVYRQRTRVVTAELGDDVGLYGAVALALDGHS